MRNDDESANTAQPAPALPAPHSLRPPLIGIYRLADPEDVAAARSMRSGADAAALYAFLREHTRWRNPLARSVLLKAASFWRTGRGEAAVLLDDLCMHPLGPVAKQLAAIPDSIVNGAGTPAEIAAAVIYRHEAFKPPHTGPRRRRRAA